MQTTPGVQTRMGAVRRKDRVMEIMHRLPPAAQESIIESLSPEEQRHYGVRPHRGQPQQVGARPQGDGVPNQHHGQLPADQVARIPGGGQPPRPGTHRMPPPRDNGPGGR